MSYLALLLTLPSERYLGEQMDVVDVEAIHLARERTKKTIATGLYSELLKLYEINHVDESGQFDAQAIGRRRLKNVCLSYLTMLDDETAHRRSKKQYVEANNMTDQIAALTCIINSRHPDKERCLEQFYRQWRDHPLVIDKWFTLQATSHIYGNLDTILQLTEHPAFDLKNPNRVRSLIGAFSQANPLHFHSVDGGGYEFLGDRIILLNPLNPQVASRMLAAFTQWHRFDAQRQQLMQKQLERIISTPDIAIDIYEIAKKSLDY